MIEINLHGIAGEDYSAATVQTALQAGGAVRVTINSAGGIATEGTAVFALLAAHRAPVRVEVIGIAASAASLIAMAGREEIVMRAGALMMIHDPSAFVIGTSDDMAKSAEDLDRLAMAYARIYASRSGKSVDECREIMRAETWFDGSEAVAAGFATHTEDAPAEAYAQFDYTKYHNAEHAFASAKAGAAGWKQAFAKLNSTATSRAVTWVP